MTVFALIVVVAIGLTAVIASRLAPNAGLNPSYAAAGAVVVCIVLLGLLQRAARWWLLPLCCRRRCGPNDYTYVDLSPTGLIYKCRCEEHYLLERRRFMLIDQNGQPHPFMERRCSICRWRPADRPPPIVARHS